jgi:segregation and condensation protein A
VTGTERAPFRVDLEGFEGPLDLLLDLARAQKVDLKRISVVGLAEQFLAYLEEARAQRLEVAAEYLVMAAWLAYLKSQLLLPAEERAALDAAAIAADLAERLRRLEAIRAAILWLETRPRLGCGRLPRGLPEAPVVQIRPRWIAGLGELLAAYGQTMARARIGTLNLERPPLLTVEAALEQLARQLTGHDWRDLQMFLPPSLRPGDPYRAAMAATLVASLELARSGQIDLQQAAPFGPIMVRRRG